ncbi:carboxypeptidase M32 [Ktedonosporobacter rubrisoli]|uniref:Metal-dependent carboxypeptidase n=1 Tax=Ktedonosporobacter rubrisoli TaxID=2509675 RepID=A0A4P6JJT0_KTERU|nr:carboxypeptidase M32 [Ktedonosporobacter rubrisoli]QBD74896.1 carboxypeptidase M32 [Ktedonosporobacter rubrisoli]
MPENAQKAIHITKSQPHINELLHQLQEVVDLQAIFELADWDAQSALPDGAREARAHQMALLQALIHERLASPHLGKLLGALEKLAPTVSFSAAEQGLLRQAVRLHHQATCLPVQLIKEIEQTRIICENAWKHARTHNNFAEFAPYLERMLTLQRKKADHLGWQSERYDALLDLYEPGCSVHRFEKLVAPIRQTCMALLEQIQAKSQQSESSMFQQDYPQERLKQLAGLLLASINYDHARGQLGNSAHPMTTSLSAPVDVRLSVRSSDLLSLVTSTLHEGGHALYAQGMARELLRTTLASKPSHGIDESQSRLWENAIGRSDAFWQGQYQSLQAVFPQPFREIPVNDFVRALNQVRPGPIRTVADEVCYNLHIFVRYELERGMINGDIAVESLPRLWNEKYRTYLGIEPESDANGVLQDIHWTSTFGYFPTYTLGNLYAAQIFHALRTAIPEIEPRLASGETAFILEWLQEHMYRFGAIYGPEELMVQVSGEAPNPRYLTEYLTHKFSKLYQLEAGEEQ